MEQSKMEDKYRAEDDARMLVKYQEIIKDKKRLENAKKELDKKMKEIEGAMECCKEEKE